MHFKAGVHQSWPKPTELNTPPIYARQVGPDHHHECWSNIIVIYLVVTVLSGKLYFDTERSWSIGFPSKPTRHNKNIHSLLNVGTTWGQPQHLEFLHTKVHRKLTNTHSYLSQWTTIIRCCNVLVLLSFMPVTCWPVIFSFNCRIFVGT